MSNMLQDGQEILEGRFQIIKKLGSGAFGEIYKGKSPSECKVVCACLPASCCLE